MDPITQGALGAAVAMAVYGRKAPRDAAILGWLGGMAADLDVFVANPSDPLSMIVHHRGITHSLAFIPIGAFLPLLPFMIRKERREQWRELYWMSALGYATHGLLDACTSYGTQLLLPFSNVRISWDFIGIVDPWYTIPLIAGVVWTAWKKLYAPVAVALAWSFIYMGIGAVQHERALDAIRDRAAARGDSIEHVRAMPAPFKLTDWRSAYRDSEKLQVDRIAVPYFAAARVEDGGTRPLARMEELPAELRDDPKARRGFEVFSWFADGYVAWVDTPPNTLGDFRYTDDMQAMTTFWGARFDARLPHKVKQESFRNVRQIFSKRPAQGGKGDR